MRGGGDSEVRLDYVKVSRIFENAFALGTTAGDSINVYPEFDYKSSSRQIRSDMRATDRLFQYRLGAYRRFSFSLEYVVASEAAQINSWFHVNQDLLFFVSSDTTIETYSVRLVNQESPLSQLSKPYQNMFKGKIELEEY